LATASYVLGQALVEGCEVAAMHASQLCQVGISYLPVADDALGWHAGVLDVIGPELVSLVAGRAGQDGPCRGGGLALPGEQAHQAALGDRAGCEALAERGEPVLGWAVVDVVFHEQGYEQVRVEEDAHRSSSSRRRTSSEVIVLPSRATGSPVRVLVRGWRERKGPAGHTRLAPASNPGGPRQDWLTSLILNFAGRKW
jgi:hypothetical protein